MGRILLVDDNPSVLETLSTYLRLMGHEITTAANGGEALVQLDSASFDVLITDCRMPVLTGIQLLQHLRSRGVATPAIMVSGTWTPEERKQARDLGAVLFNKGAMDLGELAAEVARLGGA